MINAIGDLSAFDMELGETAMLHASTKSVDGRIFIDARKWYKYPNLTEYVPTKKGLNMVVADWKRAMPLLQALIDGKV